MSNGWVALGGTARVRWRAAVAAPSERFPATLAPFLEEAFAEVMPAVLADGGALTLGSAVTASCPALKEHVLFRLFFGSSPAHLDAAPFSGELALGPLGLARITQRPAETTALLVYEKPELPRVGTAAGACHAAAAVTVRLVAATFASPPDAAAKPGTHRTRLAQLRSGLLDEQELARIDRSAADASFVPTDAAAWTTMRRHLTRVEGIAARDVFCVRFCTADVIGPERVRFRRLTVGIERSTYALSSPTVEELGDMACALKGRP